MVNKITFPLTETINDTTYNLTRFYGFHYHLYSVHHFRCMVTWLALRLTAFNSPVNGPTYTSGTDINREVSDDTMRKLS